MRVIFLVLLIFFISSQAIADSENYKIVTTTNGQTIMIDAATGNSWVWVPIQDKVVEDWINDIMTKSNFTVDYKRLLIQSNTRPLIISGRWQKVDSPR